MKNNSLKKKNLIKNKAKKNIVKNNNNKNDNISKNTIDKKIKNKKFVKLNSIQFKILTFIFITLLIIFISSTIIVYNNQRENLFDETSKNIELSVQILITALKNLMLDGQAPIVVDTMNQLKQIYGFNEITILRRNGELAFSDYATMDTVNNNIGTKYFKKTPRIEDKRSSEELKHHLIEINTILKTSSPIQNSKDDEMVVEFFYPIVNQASCMKCHGSDHSIRGIVDVQISTASIFRKIKLTRNFLIIFFSSIGLILIVILYFMIRQMILKPVLTIGSIVKIVGQGNFKVRIPLKKNDEIGELGDKINEMIKGLEERFILSRYVSNTTERFIKSSSVSEKESNFGEKREVTVLFSDIRSFTSFSESHSPEVVVENLNKILGGQSEIVEKYNGDIDKFVGDEIMAVFNNPLDAIKAAYHMIMKVIEIDKETHQSLKVGIGINSGEVIAGNIGYSKRLEYAIIGDTVNVASRLCSIAPPSQILISENVYNKVKDKVIAKLVTGKKIKGKKNPINFYIVKSIKM